jgi:hypothetical protein
MKMLDLHTDLGESHRNWWGKSDAKWPRRWPRRWNA